MGYGVGMTSRPIVVHSLAHARAALRAAAALGVPAVLLSAPAAAGYAGPAWFERLIAAAQDEHPSVTLTAVLDCGTAAGDVMAVLRWCAQPGRIRPVLVFSGDTEIAERLADMARESGLTLQRERPAGLDLAREADPEAACRAWLATMAPGTDPGV